ncbi:Uncharacterized protein BP5553_04978 [Venustampulla echinocandica]|uniref:Uncharacterized protein n=1 Tax=Venustampulla echinocandica TaxID=2656787 RepID=A0A370TPU0_9HELO|nr:Uncharacterized protein BP5553_04978 [Venustampulla echinocandica]RDL37545.1 Uncharacterized protein BP5553_04978 [Venustampulla echinocandica]
MSSPLASGGPAPPSSRRASRFTRRSYLRNGTFILPATGERVRRQITLRNPANFRPNSSDDSNDPNQPLLRFRRPYSRASTFHTAVEKSLAVLNEFWQWLKTDTAKAILKCSLAYLLGSMGTFLPPLARFLGKQDGKHIVATITVYFHPARSAGSMEEGTLLGVAAFIYATLISISSMAVSVFIGSKAHIVGLAYTLILLVFCGGGLGLTAWVKQRYSTPLVNVAASLASLGIITVLTKENAVHVGIFDDDKIVQMMKMVIMGLAASFFVSVLVWPVSARTELRETMIKTTDSLGDMLTMITGSFLSGSEKDMSSSSFNTTLATYKSVIIQLTKNLNEAKFEHYFLGTEEQYRLEASLVNCMQMLAQSIGGLRSAAATQFSLLRESSVSGGVVPANRGYFDMADIHGGSPSSPSVIRPEHFAVLTAIEEASEEGSATEEPGLGSTLKRTPSGTNVASASSSMMPPVRTPAEIFSRFIIHLGPCMKSLAYTLSQILEELPFGSGPDYAIAINEHFHASLTDALKLYSDARSEALRELYKSKELDRDRPESIEADFEEVAASCGHFSFSLQDFAEDMQNFLTILEDLKEQTKSSQRSWKWARFWQKAKHREGRGTNNDPDGEPLLAQVGHTEQPKGRPKLWLRRGKSTSGKAENHENSKWPIHPWILRIVKLFERDDLRFAIKVGGGAALYALVAFLPATRPFYRQWRGEWGLVSYMLVCSMTIGASNTTGIARFGGTFVGAVCAILVWVSCQGNPFALAFCGWLFSLPCFYLIVAKGKGPLGRFTLLTYNLSCLYAYSLSVQEGEDDDDEGGDTPAIIEIAMHRVVAVFAGIIWGLIITRIIWPISARRKFKDGLSLLCLRMGLIWKRDPLSTLLEGESANPYMNLQEEFALQRYVRYLDTMRKSAGSEFQLRGPFPSKTYGRILDSTTKMLDAFHAMNVVIQKDPIITEGEASLLRYTTIERAQLCARISHLFQVLASSIKLEYPINEGGFPSAANPRDRLLAKIFHYRKTVAGNEHEGSVIAKDEDYELLYAYALVTGQLAEEIERVERDIQYLFGVLDEDLLKLR